MEDAARSRGVDRSTGGACLQGSAGGARAVQQYAQPSSKFERGAAQDRFANRAAPRDLDHAPHLPAPCPLLSLLSLPPTPCSLIFLLRALSLLSLLRALPAQCPVISPPAFSLPPLLSVAPAPCYLISLFPAPCSLCSPCSVLPCSMPLDLPAPCTLCCPCSVLPLLRTI